MWTTVLGDQEPLGFDERDARAVVKSGQDGGEDHLLERLAPVAEAINC
jgi:hypothetical protein